MKKTLIIQLFITIFILSFTSKAFAGKLLVKSCTNCTEVQYKYKAQEVYRPSTVVVIDAQKDNIRTFNVRREFIDDFIEVYRAKAISTPTSIMNSFVEYINKKNSYKASLISEYGMTDTPYNRITGGSNELNAFDFMSSSSLRNSTYAAMVEEFPLRVATVETWNKFVNSVTVSYGGIAQISANLDKLGFQQKIIFTNGSWVIVNYDDVKETLEVIYGRDSAGNDIAQPNSTGVDQYEIANEQHLTDLTEYLDRNWMAEFINVHYDPYKGQSCTLECKVKVDKLLECTVRCK